MGKGTKRTKGKTLALGDFIGETGSGNTVNVGGKAVDLPTAPRASTLEIDISKVHLLSGRRILEILEKLHEIYRNHQHFVKIILPKNQKILKVGQENIKNFQGNSSEQN